MSASVGEDCTIGEIERGIPFPVGHKKPLSAEQKQLLQLKDGESFVLALHFGEYANDTVRQLVQWGRMKGINTVQRKIDGIYVRIWRVGAMQSAIAHK
jgi:hypothetical protein